MGVGARRVKAAHRGGLEVIPGVRGTDGGLSNDGVDPQRHNRAEDRLRPHRLPICALRRVAGWVVGGQTDAMRRGCGSVGSGSL
jgi:hypothetical protein